MCGLGHKNFSVEFFKEGALNKLYIISAIETRTGNRVERILRFSMPIHPWYTIQSGLQLWNLSAYKPRSHSRESLFLIQVEKMSLVWNR
jgi:hypothetical protein